MRTILVLIGLINALSAFAQAQKPNIVMIAVDDLNDWVGVYGGNPQIKTPNIDRLAQTSMVFKNSSCPGPVCCPSRSSLLSGFMPSKTGVYGNGQNMLNSEIVQTHATLPEYFSRNGYLTISSGKVFHETSTQNGEDQGQWAFDIWEDAKGGGKVQESKSFSRAKGIINGKKIDSALYSKEGGVDFAFGPMDVKKEATKDYRTAKWFEEKLEVNYDKPFFMAVGISKPHLPFYVPEEFFNMYGLDTLKVPEFRMDDLDDIVDKNGKKVYQPENDFLWIQHYGIQKEAVRAYMAAVSYADACVGVVLDAIAKSKYAKNTIVILFGDHGWHLGEKLRYRKATLWRESTQLPFLFHVPGMKERQDCNRNVNLIDIYPTLIELCNLPKKELDGKSIVPLLKKPGIEWTPTITTKGKGEHSVMSEKWHYIVGRKGAEELYNLEKDPMEWTNLINEKSLETELVIKQLRAYLPVNDAEPVTDASKSESKTEGAKSPRVLDLTIKSKRILSRLE